MLMEFQCTPLNFPRLRLCLPLVRILLSKKSQTQRERRQKDAQSKKLVEKDDNQISPWTLEEETAVYKALVRISEISVYGNERKKDGFYLEILEHMHINYPIIERQTYDMMEISGARDEDYTQLKLLNFVMFEYGVPFTIVHCRAELRDCLKWKGGELPKSKEQRQENSKRYKSSENSSLFNTTQSGAVSFNLNTNVRDDEDEGHDVQEDALARLTINEYVDHTQACKERKSYNVEAFIEIRKRGGTKGTRGQNARNGITSSSMVETRSGAQNYHFQPAFVGFAIVAVVNITLKTESQNPLRPKEILEYHKCFGAVQAPNAFGPEGHMGVCVLTFDGSIEGYVKAELLSKIFENQGQMHYVLAQLQNTYIIQEAPWFPCQSTII
ncbi:hypothetical protein Tco_1051682 [Tanacetum coccineum]